MGQRGQFQVRLPHGPRPLSRIGSASRPLLSSRLMIHLISGTQENLVGFPLIPAGSIRFG